MKRVMAAVLAGVMAFSLTACGGGAAKDAGSGRRKGGKDLQGSIDGRRRRLRFSELQ